MKQKKMLALTLFMKRRIGILTSGGDCPGLNACIRGVARASYSMFDAEIIGIQDGYAGLIAGDYKEMKQSDFSGILTLGGTILGSSTVYRFALDAGFCKVCRNGSYYPCCPGSRTYGHCYTEWGCGDR